MSVPVDYFLRVSWKHTKHSDWNKNMICMIRRLQAAENLGVLLTSRLNSCFKKNFTAFCHLYLFFYYLLFQNLTFQRKPSCSIWKANCSFSKQLLWFSCWTRFRCSVDLRTAPLSCRTGSSCVKLSTVLQLSSALTQDTKCEAVTKVAPLVEPRLFCPAFLYV